MPIAGGSGNPRIELESYVDQSDFDAKIAAMDARLNEMSAGLVKQSNDISAAAQTSTMSWTDFHSMYSTVLDVVRVGEQIWDEVGQKYVDNAVKVGDMARSLGTTTEEASRLKEMADDVGISVQSLTTAFKLAQKDGFQPSVEGLAAMSDEYLKLAPGVERTQFLLDRFGKSGEEMGKLLDKGSTAIRANAAAIEQGLIVTQKGYEEARKYQVATDALKDSWDAFTYQAAPPLVAAVTTAINMQRDHNTAVKEATELGKNWYLMTKDQQQVLLDKAKAERESADAALISADASKQGGDAFQTEADKARDLKKALEETQTANANIIKDAEAIQQTFDNYVKSQDEIRTKIGELKTEKEKLYPWETAKIQENKDKIDELSQKYDDNAEAYRAAMEKKWALAAVDKISMDDGVAGFSDAEFEKAKAILETTDVATAGAFDQQHAQDLVIAALDSGRIKTEDFGKIMKTVMADGVVSTDEVTAAINAIPEKKTVTVTVQMVGGTDVYGASAGLVGPKASGVIHGHASGGDFMVPPAYGNEGFMLGNGDTASAGEKISITPAGQKSNNGDLIKAIYASKIDEDSLANKIMVAMMARG